MICNSLYNFYCYPLPELFVAVFILLHTVYSVFFSSSKNFCTPAILKSTTLLTIFCLVLVLFLLGTDSSAPYNFSEGFSRMDTVGSSFKGLLLLTAIFLSLISRDYLNFHNVFRYEYDLLFIFLIFGLLLLCCSDDFLTVYLSLELVGLCSYVLSTFSRSSEFSTEAGIKYFVLGAFSSGLMLFGFLFIYLFFGATSFEAISRLLFFSNSLLAFLGSLLITVALFFKIGAAPFHLWLCDVYEGSLTTVTALFSAAPKLVLLTVLVKLHVFVFAEHQESLTVLLLFSGASSVFFGSVAGLYQKRLKRLIAYSTISHTGFMLLAISLSSVDAIKSFIVYITLYVITSLAIFSVILLVGASKKSPKYLVN